MARHVIEALARFALLSTILAYRTALSPFLGGACRYLPSCSRYAEEAIALHGPWRGARLAVARLLRCHPWGGFGHDPVPARKAVTLGGSASGSAGASSTGRRAR